MDKTCLTPGLWESRDACASSAGCHTGTVFNLTGAYQPGSSCVAVNAVDADVTAGTHTSGDRQMGPQGKNTKGQASFSLGAAQSSFTTATKAEPKPIGGFAGSGHES